MLSDLFHFLSHVRKQIHRTTRRRNLGSPGCYNIVLRSKVKIGDKQRKPRLSRNFSDTLYLICQLLMCPQPPADCPCRSIVQEFQQSRRPLSRLETFFCNYVNGTLFFSHFSLKKSRQVKLREINHLKGVVHYDALCWDEGQGLMVNWFCESFTFSHFQNTNSKSPSVTPFLVTLSYPVKGWPGTSVTSKPLISQCQYQDW